MSTATATSSSAPGGVENLFGSIDTKASFCLNQHPSHPFSNLFVGDSTLFLRSDVDGQLLVNLVFRNAVKITAISIGAPNDDSAPTSVRLFANLPSPGFSDVEDGEAAQHIALTPAALSPDTRIPVKVVKFQSVNNLVLFFDANNGSDFTQIYSIKVFGTVKDRIDVAAIHEKHEH